MHTGLLEPRAMWMKWKITCCLLLLAACGSQQKDLNRGTHQLCAAPTSGAAVEDEEEEEAARADLPAAVARTMKVGDTERSYRVFIPRGLDKTRPVALVSVHHGYTMSAKTMERITSWKRLAQREQFVVAFAEGLRGAPWNVGEDVCGAGASVSALETQDDFGFVRAILSHTEGEQRIDTQRVFVAGFSMGGYFANHIACRGRDFVRAVAAHSAGTYAGSCPGKPIPVLLIHGDADSLIRYSCGQEAHNAWAARNGCSYDTRCEPIKHGACAWNTGCPRGQEVGMCTLHEMSHGWAGARYTGPWLFLQYGGGSQYEDAAELMWTFFARSASEAP